MELHPQLFEVENLSPQFGEKKYNSPLSDVLTSQNFVEDHKDRILVDVTLNDITKHVREVNGKSQFLPPTFEIAGPRRKLFWEGKSIQVAIVTCGGLAPGLNNVIQSLVTCLHDLYQVDKIYGVPCGYFGFAHDPDTKKFQFPWPRLDPHLLRDLDKEAGSYLGVGRGHSDPVTIVDALVLRNIDILFTLGGDGTLTGAHAIAKEIKKRKLPIAVIGIPKTIDNDILWVSKSFGFETAVGKAAEAIKCAQTEARSAFNGIGLVKLMGRNSGSLTANAAASVPGIDFVLVPEIELKLDGDEGFLAHLVQRVKEKGHATIACAEGCGQNLFPDAEKIFDASGNAQLNDIGKLLKNKINKTFEKLKIEHTIKYIDPSYILRAQTTTAEDGIFCAHLGQHAAHAALSGKTNFMVGLAHDFFTHVPLEAVTLGKKYLDIDSPLWLSVLSSTGQPAHW